MNCGKICSSTIRRICLVPIVRVSRLAITTFVLWASMPSSAASMEAAISRLAQALANEVHCDAGQQALVGIFPFDEASIPIAPQNAFRLYEDFLGSLIVQAPDCIRFIDGRGAFVTLNYLERSGTLRQSGQQQRQNIQDSLGSADYILDGSVLERGGEASVIFQLTNLSDGTAIARERFAMPDEFKLSLCGDGALPKDVALQRIANSMLNRIDVVNGIIASGGIYANSDQVTDAGRYLEDQLVAHLSRAGENAITGRAIRVRRTAPDEVYAQLEPGIYALLVRYWPCDGDETARLSVTLRSHDGRDVTEIHDVRLSTLPGGLALRPRTEPRISGEMKVYPTLATIGTEISFLADPPPYCDPFFFNLTPSGRVTPIPIEFFRQLDLGRGIVRYEISPRSDFGLVIEPDDEVGLNQLGYLCQPVKLQEMAGLQGIMRRLLALRQDVSEGEIEVEGLPPIYFQLSGFEIVF
jgi:hypothetical protein